jgi:hypothetical protein
MAAEDYFNTVDYRNDQNAQIDSDDPIHTPIDRSNESGFGSNFFNWGKNLWNKIPSGDDITKIYGENENQSILEGTKDESSLISDDGGGGGAFDSANFNVQDKNQVMELQKQLFPDDPSQWDGVFGPNTQGAYRTMVNQQRTDAGQDAYTYGSSQSAPQVNDTNQGLLQVNPISQNVASGQTPFEQNQAARQQHQQSVGQNTGFGDGQGWFNQMGQGGEGFMGKFGTGKGWLSRGKERRAARKQ